MFDKTIISHQHIGNKIIRLDTLEDYDGTQYTQTEVDSFLVTEHENDLSRYEIEHFSLHSESIDADNNGLFVDIKKSGVEESVQIG